MELFYRGTQLSIWLCPGAQVSWDEAEVGARDSCRAQLRARIGLLGDAGKLRSPDHINFEGSGIFAIKANCGLRAYGWFGQINARRAFAISHVMLKKQQKLAPKDLTAAIEARDNWEKEQRK